MPLQRRVLRSILRRWQVPRYWMQQDRTNIRHQNGR